MGYPHSHISDRLSHICTFNIILKLCPFSIFSYPTRQLESIDLIDPIRLSTVTV
jgi:hypothetical protein